MKIFVTGAGGMVGRNLLADPRARAHDILAPSHDELDLTDAAATTAYVYGHKPDLIIHLAAVVGGIQANIDEPSRFLADNLAIGLNLLGAASRARIPRLINLGSSCMYPAGVSEPLTENRLLTGAIEPTSAGYALAKLAAWELTRSLAIELHGLCYRTLIPPNLYGRFDNFDPIRSHLLAAAVLKIDAAIAEGRDEVCIWGDGEARREFMFAADLADFIWEFQDRLDELPATLNVGVGEDHTVNALYRQVGEALGYRGGYANDLARPAGMRRKLLDVTGQRRLGWSPRTTLAEGIVATADFLRVSRRF